MVDLIDELMASECDEMGVPLDDFRRDRYDKCEACQQDWHGLPRLGCAGAYGPGEPEPEQRYLGYVTTDYEGTPCQVHLYDDGHGEIVGLLMPIGDQRELTYTATEFTMIGLRE